VVLFPALFVLSTLFATVHKKQTLLFTSATQLSGMMP